MKMLVAAACVAVISLTAYIIAGDYLSARQNEDQAFRAECQRIVEERSNVDASKMTSSERAAAVALAESCLAAIKGKS